MQSGFRFFVVKKPPKIGYDPMVLEYQYGIKKRLDCQYLANFKPGSKLLVLTRGDRVKKIITFRKMHQF